MIMKHEAATRLAGFIDVIALSHAIGTKDLKLLRDTYYNNDASRIPIHFPTPWLNISRAITPEPIPSIWDPMESEQSWSGTPRGQRPGLSV